MSHSNQHQGYGLAVIAARTAAVWCVLLAWSLFSLLCTTATAASTAREGVRARGQGGIAPLRVPANIKRRTRLPVSRVARLRAPRPVLSATPSRVELKGPYAEARLLIDSRGSGGAVSDVSSEVALSSIDRAVAEVDADGTIRPHRNGRTQIVVRLRGAELRVPVEVRGITPAGAPRFLTDVMPVLTKSGCNQGGCHGAASGKGGLKLSLLGYDPEADYDAITRAAGARRVTRSQPERSLLLRKPALQVAHRGGKRFGVGSPEYRLLLDWIAAGLPRPSDSEPRVVRLEVLPAARALPLGQTQRFLVRAHYSDGSQRDVTGQTLFTSSDESLTAVDPTGAARPVAPGEGAVVIRYQGLVATARLVTPFGVRRADQPSRDAEGRTMNAGSRIDQLVDAKLSALGLAASGRCTDAEFVRRAYLDAIGMLPTPDEVRRFLRDPDPKRREKLIDALLERPEYVDFWTLKWADILRCSRRSLTEKGMYSFYRWIRQSVAENKPWDRFARELLVARGSSFREGSANYFRVAGRPEDLAETTAQVFLGVRVQCARCHNHPFEKWTQQQYYELAAFFSRVRSKEGEVPEEREIYLAAAGEVKHPRTGKQMTPTALDAAPLPAEYSGDRRQALAEWLTSPQNPYFGRVIANRLWRHFLGRGLVEPVDDLRATNPPTNEALLDWLAEDLARHGYDLKYLVRTIMLSETYQRSSQPRRGNERDTRYYSHFPFKRLGAEQLLDAIGSATGVPEKFPGLPPGTRATQLPDNAVPSYFLELFGRPARQIACECERTSEPSVAQVLHLMNNAGLNEKLASGGGRVAALVQSNLPVHRLVDELYLAALSRFPTPEESRTSLASITKAPDRRRAAEDLLWALLNSKEFLFNH